MEKIKHWFYCKLADYYVWKFPDIEYGPNHPKCKK